MKLQEIEFPKGTHPTFWNFYDRTKQIFNNSRYQLRVVTETPNWAGDDGEMLILNSGTTHRFYAYFDNVWYYIDFDGGEMGTQISKSVASAAIGTVIYTVPTGKTFRLTSEYLMPIGDVQGSCYLSVRNTADILQYDILAGRNGGSYNFCGLAKNERYPYSIPAGYDIYVRGSVTCDAGILGWED